MSATTTSVVKATLTIIGNAGATLVTHFPPAPTVTKAAVASILDPSHPDPTAFNASDPLVLFIIQAFVIVGFSRLLGFFLGKIRQPKVISEVIAGILIGPSVFGRIPHFTQHIFPPPSIPYLSLVANFGLVFFLFLVGLEVDFSLFRQNFRSAGTISLVGMVVPFALGAAVSVGIYNRFVDESKVKFGTFLLFLGTANAITAFPVLARILTELQLLSDPVGVIVLTAGVGNDVVGWILLALAVALVNASSGIIVLYVLLCAVGWILVLWFIVRPLLIWWCRATGVGKEKPPSELLVCAVMFLVLISAWVTDRIGIHAIFGGFVAGLIVPHEIRDGLIQKIEDFVSCLFLPLYFALSGLNTNLGLLANGSIWGWTVCVIIVAFAGKFISCGVVAKLNGMAWRESGAVGSLMACKGLVELIVLNIGLNAGILNPEVFAMFVTMALVTTFATTPLALAFYPVSYRLKKRAALSTSPIDGPGADIDGGFGKIKSTSRYAVVLQQFDHLTALFSFVRLVQPPYNSTGPGIIPPVEAEIVDEKSSPAAESPTTPTIYTPRNIVSIAALRLIELTDRTSALIRASESPKTLLASDSLANVFSSFSSGSGVKTNTSLEIVTSDAFPSHVASHAAENRADLLVVPWALGNGKTAEASVMERVLPNPFETVFGRGGAVGAEAAGYAAFVRKVFTEAACDVSLFLDRGTNLDSPSAGLPGRAHIFFAFHGGADDRACLNLVVQLITRNPGLSATVTRFSKAAEPTQDDLGTKFTTRNSGSVAEDVTPILFSQLTVQGGQTGADTIYPTQHDLASETADSLALAAWFDSSSSGRTPEVEAGLARITFNSISTIQPLHLTIARARATAQSKGIDVPFIVVAGRGRRGAMSHTKELGEFLKENLESVHTSIVNSSEVRRAVGDLAVAYLVAGLGTSIMVVQSAGHRGTHKPKNV